MKVRTAESVSIRITDVEPLDARFVQIVSEYLDGIHTWVTTNPDTHHVRLLTARPPRISNTEIQVIRAAFPTAHIDQTPIPRWVRASVIIWHRELVELEKLRRSGLAIDVSNTCSVSSSRDCAGELPH